MVNGLIEAYAIIKKVSEIEIYHKKYGYIPLEIAVGLIEIDCRKNIKLINRKETITFLKQDIINPYRHYYKKSYNKKIRETFVLFTEDLYNTLNPFDQNYCDEIDYLFFKCDLNKLKQRCKIYNFLNKIDRKESKLFERIDDLYVPPIEYDNIKNSLNKNKIVFITGTAEYGKTFTAIRLLWEYYLNKGYEPGWIKGGEERQRIEVREKLEDIVMQLKPHHIFYFEDPFGKIKYEKRESLEREIGTIIDYINKVNDVYVIITSREEVFKEFENEKLSKKDIKKFEEKLNLKRASYDYDRRQRILLNWAKVNNCEWLSNYELTNFVIKQIKDRSHLPTPLCIKEFAVVSKDADRKDRIIELINDKSTDTVLNFAQEIKYMNEDKILFLTILLISERFNYGVLELLYSNLVKALNINNHYNFIKIFNWFIDDKIISGSTITFSHPSYKQSLEYLLSDDSHFYKIRNMLPVILKNITKTIVKINYPAPIVKEDINRFIIDHYNFIPSGERIDLLIDLSNFDETAKDIALIFYEKYNQISKKAKLKLIENLSNHNSSSKTVAHIISINFDKLPEKIRNKALLSLTKFDHGRINTILCIIKNKENLPSDIVNTLHTKSDVIEDMIDSISVDDPEEAVKFIYEAREFINKDYIKDTLKFISDTNPNLKIKY